MYTHHQTIFNKLLSFILWSKFDALIRQHQLDKQYFSGCLAATLFFTNCPLSGSLETVVLVLQQEVPFQQLDLVILML
ncbi:MAG: DUF4372 domain-containing protein [Candidatus Peribacteria bacterium]|jgi:hypothetical protein|nr:DUF4372 domain-containing protein [Candidatus Peribacteria bacterium]